MFGMMGEVDLRVSQRDGKGDEEESEGMDGECVILAKEGRMIPNETRRKTFVSRDIEDGDGAKGGNSKREAERAATVSQQGGVGKDMARGRNTGSPNRKEQGS